MEEKEHRGNKIKESIDIKGINTVINIIKKILRILLYVIIIGGIYLFVVLGKELGVFRILLKLLGIISPLFIGLAIAWLFNPLVKWLTKKGIRRGLATTLIYVVGISSIALILCALIPTLYNQILDFTKVLPSILDKVQDIINKGFDALEGIKNLDVSALKENAFTKLEELGSDISSTLPETVLGTISSFLSGIGTILVGLIIGFFLLISFDNTDSVIEFLPKKMQKTTRELLASLDGALRSFVTGSILDCTFIFIISSIGLYFVGLKSPLLFGLFCGITNIIPYAGPYIGGAPAVVVAFSQGIPTGILTLVVIFIIQFLEGNFLQPVILSKTTKLHPVSIILGLLVFGYFWGIIGMVIATPLIACIKAILLFFDEKYDILNFK